MRPDFKFINIFEGVGSDKAILRGNKYLSKKFAIPLGCDCWLPSARIFQLEIVLCWALVSPFVRHAREKS